MKLHKLPKLKARPKKRLGRGLGSGKGKTGGRGQKGQKARGKIPAANVGGGLILYKKLPFRRGLSRKGGNPPRLPKPILISLSSLNQVKAKTHINVNTLIENGLVKAKNAKIRGVKILANGKLQIPLVVELPVSKKAKELIEKAGGNIGIIG